MRRTPICKRPGRTLRGVRSTHKKHPYGPFWKVPVPRVLRRDTQRPQSPGAFSIPIRACCITDGWHGFRQDDGALLPLQAIVRRLPGLKTSASECSIARANYSTAQCTPSRTPGRARGREREDSRPYRDRGLCHRVSLSPYNIWRAGTMRSQTFSSPAAWRPAGTLTSGEKLSLRGASVLKHILSCYQNQSSLTHLDRVLGMNRSESVSLQQAQRRTGALLPHPLRAEGSRPLRRSAPAWTRCSPPKVSASPSRVRRPDFLRLQNEGKIVLINCAGPLSPGVRLALAGTRPLRHPASDLRASNNPRVTYWWCADEAQNFFLTRQMQENLTDILTMARSFGTFFYFLCQNLSTAVPDARMLETLYTNIAGRSPSVDAT